MLSHINSEKGQAMLALAIYRLVLFPKVKGYIDSDLIKLFEKIQHHVNPILTILAEMIRSLNHCRREEKRQISWMCLIVSNMDDQPPP